MAASGFSCVAPSPLPPTYVLFFHLPCVWGVLSDALLRAGSLGRGKELRLTGLTPKWHSLRFLGTMAAFSSASLDSLAAAFLLLFSPEGLPGPRGPPTEEVGQVSSQTSVKGVAGALAEVGNSV